jgi:UPF0176 protein
MKPEYVVILFYKFMNLPDPKAVMNAMRATCQEHQLLGRIIIAEEGVNGTLEGTRENIENYKKALKKDPLFSDMPIKESLGNGKAFTKLKVKVRAETVTLGVGKLDVPKETGNVITPTDLNKLYESKEDFVLIDFRNTYEIDVGKFDNTIDPGLANFRDLPAKLPELKQKYKDKKVVTVCTGDIRCEKATCLLRREGFSDVYHLKDGIHTYMKEYPGQHFKGSLFVFDNRLTTDVVKIENKEIIGQCRYCKTPTEDFYADDRVRPSKKVLCCPACYEINKSHLRDCSTEKVFL